MEEIKSNGFMYIYSKLLITEVIAKPQSLIGNVNELRTGGRWFDPGLSNILSEHLRYSHYNSPFPNDKF